MRELAADPVVDIEELVGDDSELQTLLELGRLSAAERASVVRYYLHGLADEDATPPGIPDDGIAPGSRKVYRFRGLQKLAHAQRFLARVQSLPVRCREVCVLHHVRRQDVDAIAAFLRRAPAAVQQDLRWGEELILARGYDREVRMQADGVPPHEIEAALLYHQEMLDVPAIASRLGSTEAQIADMIRRLHARVHRRRLSLLVDGLEEASLRALADAHLLRRVPGDLEPKQRKQLQEAQKLLMKAAQAQGDEAVFVGDLAVLDEAHRRAALAFCARRLMAADAAGLLGGTPPAVQRLIAEALGIVREVKQP
jgi:hypothetical protein